MVNEKLMIDFLGREGHLWVREIFWGELFGGGG